MFSFVVTGSVGGLIVIVAVMRWLLCLALNTVERGAVLLYEYISLLVSHCCEILSIFVSLLLQENDTDTGIQ